MRRVFVIRKASPGRSAVDVSVSKMREGESSEEEWEESQQEVLSTSAGGHQQEQESSLDVPSPSW
jgi:hypothetical protein